MRTDVAERAKSAMAIQKLVPLGEYLDLAESGILKLNPSKFLKISLDVVEIIRKFRTDTLVRETCQDSTTLLELLQNSDFENGTGVLSDSRTSMGF